MVIGYRTKIALTCLLFSIVLLENGGRLAMGEPIGWMERFALADDRQGILEELIPGSEEYFFFHCLHYQTSGQLELAEATIRDWLVLHKGRETDSITAMIDRQRLLTYGDSPQQTIDHLIRRLNIKLDHAPPATRNERRHPSRFDSKRIDIDRLVKDALRRNDALKPVGQQYLAGLYLTNQTSGIKPTLGEFLNRIDGPYIDRLDELVAREIAGRPARERRFGDLKAHQLLTMDELRSVAKSVPVIADDENFVHAILHRMRPNADGDPSQQLDVRIDYLTRVEEYVQSLPPSYNSMKASAAFRLMETNLSRGFFDNDLFLRYLKLPRQSPIVHEKWGGRHARANLGDDFMSVALLPAIGNEEPVVRAHLEHFLRNAKNTEAYSQYLRPEYLRAVFAETKLLSGVGDADQWYKLLNPAERKKVRDAVVIRITADNPRYFMADQPSELNVDIKNVDELVVRIYEVNTASYYRTNDKRIDTDIDLDGLVATHETKIAYDQPAVIRHRERLQLPEIGGRGVWIVDLVGKGVRARALLRRGSIEHVATSGPNGMVFTVIDENREPVSTATMWVGSRQFTADDHGRITIPPVIDQTSRTAIISDGSISRQIKFRHQQESYALDAGMHIDRTQLQSGGETDLVIRPRLTMAGSPIDPNALTNVTVRIEGKDLEGIATTHQLADLKVSQENELVVPIRVPNRLTALKVTLTAKIVGLADGKQQTLSTSRNWDIAGIRSTDHTQDTFLTRDGDEYVIEVRGRNGETIPRATIQVSLQTEVCGSQVDQALQADDEGQVRLGSLDGVESIRFFGASGLQHTRDLNLNQVRWANEIHTTADRPIRLPLEVQMDDPTKRYRLVGLRDGSLHEDQSQQLSVSAGLLVIDSLSPGDYRLIDRTNGRSIEIAVVAGPVTDQVATGQTRHRSISGFATFGIEAIERNEKSVKVKLSGEFTLARVHLYGTRYIDSAMPFGQLNFSLPGLRSRRVSIPRCGYISDLRLGDEYQYVLNRRYAKKYPGVMLAQPGMILNPWETEETTNVSQSAMAGDAPMASAEASDDRLREEAAQKAAAAAAQPSSDYDFLADPGVVIANLHPDKDGVITIDNEVIKGLPILYIVACDSTSMIQRAVTGPLDAAKTVDLRLAKALDASVPLTFRRGVSIASQEQPLDLQSLGSAQVQVYASVGQLFKLYQTLVSDQRLAEFEELGRWHLLDREAKLDVYSRLASHELHLFVRFHDPSFFGEVIQPYLANKKEKQFVDHWLLDEDLSSYMTLWRYNQLNAAERALLAIRVPNSRQMVRRQFGEIIQSRDVDHVADRRGIETALGGGWSTQAGERDLRLGGRVSTSNRAEGLAEITTMNSLSSSAVRNLARSRRSIANEMKSQLDKESLDVRLGKDAIGLKSRDHFMQSDPFFRDLDSTKQWAESQWDRVRTVGGPDPASRIDVNQFWADLAGLDTDSPTVSSNLLRPVDNRHAVLVALAMCGLPLSPGDVSLPTGKETLYQPAHPVAVITKRLQKLDSAANDNSVLIGQRFESLNQNPTNNRKSELRAEPTEFLTGVAYRGKIVVSNPTAAQRIVDLFWQLPSGSLPLSGSQSTDSRTVTLAPFAVQAIEYHFYFPASGEFTHYPANVADADRLIAQSEVKQFKVVDQPTEEQAVTWENVARNGTPEQITEFLAEANLRELDWMLVAHRMDDQNAYQAVMKVLVESNIPVADLWVYGFKHRDEQAMAAFLSVRQDLVERVGPVLESELLSVEPIERRTHELLEYAPLVRARIHRLGDKNQILNPTFRSQYQRFIRVLGHSRKITDADKLVLSYYLLIQNRIEEAINRFNEVDRAKVTMQLQYDYLDAYLAMHQEQFDRAEKVAKEYAAYPVPRWKQRFQELNWQLHQRHDLNQTERLIKVDRDEPKLIAEGSGDLSVMDRERQQADASGKQPEVMVRVEGDSLRIDHRNAKEVAIRFYGVDLELLFSKAPFVREDLQRMAMVRPMRVESLSFDDSTGVGRFDLDENQRRQTLLVEVQAGGSRGTALYYGGDITSYVSESYGQLQTSSAASKRPVSTAYVKVYAKYPDGSVKFYKDGYTDSRGRFDYASVSAADAKGATRYAILVLSDELGATLHDVAAPKR